MKGLHKLPAFGDDDELHVVIEAPRGARVKLKYETKLGVFVASRALPLGVEYPFDWGFVPGTMAEDGDPVDALVLHDSATYPGVLLECRPLGLLKLDERAGGRGKRQPNHRVLAMPTWHERLGTLTHADKLPERLREEVEQFFLSTTFFTAKDARLLGWEGPNAAAAFVRAHLAKR